jgi:hypothetical protein
MKTFIPLTIIACSVILLSANARAVTEADADNTSDTAFDSQITAVPTNDLIYNNVGTLSDGLTVVDGDTGPDIDFTVKGA